MRKGAQAARQPRITRGSSEYGTAGRTRTFGSPRSGATSTSTRPTSSSVQSGAARATAATSSRSIHGASSPKKPRTFPAGGSRGTASEVRGVDSLGEVEAGEALRQEPAGRAHHHVRDLEHAPLGDAGEPRVHSGKLGVVVEPEVGERGAWDAVEVERGDGVRRQDGRHLAVQGLEDRAGDGRAIQGPGERGEVPGQHARVGAGHPGGVGGDGSLAAAAAEPAPHATGVGDGGSRRSHGDGVDPDHPVPGAEVAGQVLGGGGVAAPVVAEHEPGHESLPAPSAER